MSSRPLVRVLLLATALAAAAGAGFWSRTDTGPFCRLEVNDTDVGGRPLTDADFANRVVVVVFFDRGGGARWLRDLARRVADDLTNGSLVVVGVSREASVDSTLALRAELELSVPIIQDRDMRLSNRFRAPACYPMVYVYDHRGIPREIVCLAPDLDGFELELRHLLAQRSSD